MQLNQFRYCHCEERSNPKTLLEISSSFPPRNDIFWFFCFLLNFVISSGVKWNREIFYLKRIFKKDFSTSVEMTYFSDFLIFIYFNFLLSFEFCHLERSETKSRDLSWKNILKDFSTSFEMTRIIIPPYLIISLRIKSITKTPFSLTIILFFFFSKNHSSKK